MFFLKTELNEKKKIKTEFKKIYGLNSFFIEKLCKDIGLNELSLVEDLSRFHLGLIEQWILSKNLLLNDELRKYNLDKKEGLVAIKCYRGLRNAEGLPVRGQRTKSNAKTQKRLSGFLIKKKSLKVLKKVAKVSKKKVKKKVVISKRKKK